MISWLPNWRTTEPGWPSLAAFSSFVSSFSCNADDVAKVASWWTNFIAALKSWKKSLCTQSGVAACHVVSPWHVTEPCYTFMSHVTHWGKPLALLRRRARQSYLDKAYSSTCLILALHFFTFLSFESVSLCESQQVSLSCDRIAIGSYVDVRCQTSLGRGQSCRDPGHAGEGRDRAIRATWATWATSVQAIHRLIKSDSELQWVFAWGKYKRI